MSMRTFHNPEMLTPSGTADNETLLSSSLSDRRSFMTLFVQGAISIFPNSLLNNAVLVVVIVTAISKLY